MNILYEYQKKIKSSLENGEVDNAVSIFNEAHNGAIMKVGPHKVIQYIFDNFLDNFYDNENKTNNKNFSQIQEHYLDFSYKIFFLSKLSSSYSVDAANKILTNNMAALLCLLENDFYLNDFLLKISKRGIKINPEQVLLYPFSDNSYDFMYLNDLETHKKYSAIWIHSVNNIIKNDIDETYLLIQNKDKDTSILKFKALPTLQERLVLMDGIGNIGNNEKKAGIKI